MRVSRGCRFRMNLRTTGLSISLAAAILLASSVHAHHSVRANFDMQASVEVRGTISAVNIRNPHSQYVLDVQTEDGSIAQWLVEWSDRNALIRRNVNVELIQVGDAVTFTLWPSRRLENVGYFVQAILPDGALFRDCGFREFREAVAESKEFSCPDGGLDE
jgi:hypothetical protein